MIGWSHKYVDLLRHQVGQGQRQGQQTVEHLTINCNTIDSYPSFITPELAANYKKNTQAHRHA